MSDASKGKPVGVVVPAAGRGRRMGGKRKQMRKLGGVPVLVRTVRRFAGVSAVEVVVVPTAPAVIDEVQRAFADAGLAAVCRVVAGGDTRQASVAAGLEAVPPELEDVLVHDAVRPFVTPQLIEEVIAAVWTEGAAAAAIPVADTVRRANDGWFGEVVDRENLYRMQTPQGFRRDWLEEAHRQAAGREVPATDDLALVRRLGHAVRLVIGESRNLKITTPADWELAQLLWKQEEARS